MNTNKVTVIGIMDKIAKIRTQGHGLFSIDAPMVQVSIRSIVVIEPDDKK